MNQQPFSNGDTGRLVAHLARTPVWSGTRERRRCQLVRMKTAAGRGVILWTLGRGADAISGRAGTVAEALERLSSEIRRRPRQVAA